MRTYNSLHRIKISDIKSSLKKKPSYIDIQGGGQSIRHRVNLSYIPSKFGSVPYFICPYMGTKCRILYFINGDKIASRASLKRVYYYSQTLSPRDRIIDKYHRYDDLRCLPRKHEHYAGKLTRKGKKALKTISEGRMISIEDLFSPKILKLITDIN